MASVFLLFMFATAMCCKSQLQNTIPVPTEPQLRYQQYEIVALTHFNMGTYTAPATCDSNTWNNGVNASNPKVFNPYALNVTNWAESYGALGAKAAVLTAKHTCGFCLWPTSIMIPNTTQAYAYSVKYASYTQDILKQFAETLTKYGMGYGFYYSLPNNVYLNYRDYKIGTTLLPGMVNVTQEQINQICVEQVTELWTMYGELSEIWFDGGTTILANTMKQLMAQYQPNAAVMNGQQVSPHMIRWVGSESGTVDGPIWSLGQDTGTGDPNSTQFCPANVDTTLQNGNQWFYNSGAGVRPLSALINVYHDSVGNNGVLELDFGIDETGNVAAQQAESYKEFGDWIRSCYGQAINSTNGQMTQIKDALNLIVDNGNVVKLDRVMIQEDIKYGQRIRNFHIEINPGQYRVSGTAVGHKKIMLFNLMNASSVRFVLDEYVGDVVYVENFAVFKQCSSG